MELGSVGRASYAEFAGKRNLLLLPYVTAVRDDPELRGLVGRYWEEGVGQVEKLARSLGGVRHLFHEGAVREGGEAAEMLEQGNPAGFPALKRLIDAGAAMEPTEDIEALAETLDLHRCLLVAQASDAVRTRLLEWFEDARRRRYEHIARRIAETIEEGGAGVLVIAPDHAVQFPGDIEVIYVAPPVLDTLNRWLRDHPLDAPPSAPDEPPPDGPDRDGGAEEE